MRHILGVFFYGLSIISIAIGGGLTFFICLWVGFWYDLFGLTFNPPFVVESILHFLLGWSQWAPFVIGYGWIIPALVFCYIAELIKGD